MSSQISSRRWPMITSLLVSFTVFSVLVSLREHPAKEWGRMDSMDTKVR